MPTRFDHAVIGVRDLDAALLTFQRLGFDARMGGRHEGGGTYNGLIRFGLDYVELLSVYDESLARANTWGENVLDALRGKESSLIGYALATAAIETDAGRFRGTGSAFSSPRPMQRMRPDGQLLSWRLLSPDGSSWHRPWPFLIQWDMPDEQRLRIDQPGTHLNGAQSWRQVYVAVRDLASAVEIYTDQLGLNQLILDNDPNGAVTFALGESTINLLMPTEDGSVQHILSEQGEGPFALGFQVKDLAATQAFFMDQKIKHSFIASSMLTLDPQETQDVQIFFVPA